MIELLPVVQNTRRKKARLPAGNWRAGKTWPHKTVNGRGAIEAETMNQDELDAYRRRQAENDAFFTLPDSALQYNRGVEAARARRKATQSTGENMASFSDIVLQIKVVPTSPIEEKISAFRERLPAELRAEFDALIDLISECITFAVDGED